MNCEISDIIAEIRAWHKQDKFAIKQRMRLMNAIGALLRTQFGWNPELPEKERKKIAAKSAALIACGKNRAAGKEHKFSDSDEYKEWEMVILASLAACAPFEEIEHNAEKRMAALVKELPIWTFFAVDVRGLGALSLARIIGESGDLSNYASKEKLWKRMGMAVMGTVRQGGLKKGASADDWIEHGYSPHRRSQMFVVGENLIKLNQDGLYRQAYLQRKEYELTRDPEMRPLHAHRRAQRYMEKRLLRDLWQAWRRSSCRMMQTASLNGLTASEIQTGA